jgi:hypothetical protein
MRCRVWLVMGAVVAACSGARSQESTTGAAGDGAGDAAPAAPPRAPVPAFVIYSTVSTTLVPAAAGEEPVNVEWHWGLDEARGRIVAASLVGPDDIGAPWAPACRCPEEEGACYVTSSNRAVVLREVDPASGLLRPAGPGCRCFRTEPLCETGDEVATGDADDEESDPDLDNPECACEDVIGTGSTYISLSSVAAGRLYSFGSWNNRLCNGMNVWDSRASTYELEAGSPPMRPPAGAALLGCDGQRMPGASSGPLWPLPPLPCRAQGASGAATVADSCLDCEIEIGEAGVLMLRRGSYYWAWEHQHAGGGGLLVWSWPARPERCLSPGDPCGDPALFPGLGEAIAQDLDADVDFWVATDGSHALLLEAESITILRRGETEPVAEGIPGLAVDEVIGVRFHADARPLLDAMRLEAARHYDASAADPAADAAPRACSADSGCRAGELCHGSVCAPPCRVDGDCPASGVCAAFCGAGGRCLGRSEGHCDAAHACRGGAECRDGRCVDRPRLAPEDLSLVDSRGGRDWGDRCLRHLQEGRLVEAQAACERGLEMATDPQVQGAVLFDLGRIAEERGDVEGARARYLRSLEVRGEDRAVRRRLEALDER